MWAVSAQWEASLKLLLVLVGGLGDPSSTTGAEGTLAAPLPWGPWLLGGIMHNAEGEEHPNTR